MFAIPAPEFRPLFRFQSLAQAVQLLAHRPVINRRSHAHHRAAHQSFVLTEARFDFLARAPLEHRGQLLPLRPAQLPGRTHFCLGDSHSHVQLLLQSGGNLVQYLCPAMVHDQVKKVLHRGIQPHLRGHLVDHLVLYVAAYHRAFQSIPQIRRGKKYLNECPQIALHLVREFPLQGHFRQRRGVSFCHCAQLTLLSSSATNVRNSAVSVCGVISFDSKTSARSTANRAASAFNSRRAARPAASISIWAACSILSASERASERSRFASASASRFASTRSLLTSSSSPASFF